MNEDIEYLFRGEYEAPPWLQKVIDETNEKIRRALYAPPTRNSQEDNEGERG